MKNLEFWFDDTDRGKTELNLSGYGVVQLVEARHYKSEGRGFDS
jgi:hypothetical protein